MLDTGVSRSTYSARRTNGVVFHEHELVHPRLHRYNTLTHTPVLRFTSIHGRAFIPRLVHTHTTRTHALPGYHTANNQCMHASRPATN